MLQLASLLDLCIVVKSKRGCTVLFLPSFSAPRPKTACFDRARNLVYKMSSLWKHPCLSFCSPSQLDFTTTTEDIYPPFVTLNHSFIS